MFKVMTIVGTRPELIKMSRVIAELDQHVNHLLVHTGQNYDYELNGLFFEDLGIRKPDYFLEAVGDNAAQTIARVIEKSDAILEKEKPDAVLLYGDTNSCLAVIAAKRRKIPVFHMEAGNRCFDQRVPEELNRKVLDHLSDINLVLTEHARRYLIAEGMRHKTHNIPGKFLSYLQSGLPVMAIINDGNDLRSIIEKHQVGKVTTDRSQANLRELASALIDDLASNRNEISARCKGLASELFSSKAAVDQITHSLNSVK